MAKIGSVVVAALLLMMSATAAGAVTAADLDTIADELADTGRYLEFTITDDVDRSIDDANGRGIAFAWLDIGGDALLPAQELSARLEGSSFRTTVVLTNDSIGAWSQTVDDAVIQDALDASGNDFAQGAVADGLDQFTAALGDPATTATTSGGTASGSDSGSPGGGIGIGTILLIALVGGGGFLLFRSIRNRSKARKQAELDLEADRAEITEQLRDNADHVLELGDRVIAAGKPELISTYEQASAAYQEVSGAIEGATTAEEIDRLDDMIDRAEWQFESIEAELDGRPPPPSPEEVEARAQAQAQNDEAGRADRSDPRAPRPADQPALGPDESILDGPPPPGRAPAPRQRVPVPRSSRRGGFGGGGLGGVLGGVLGSIVLGGGMGGGSRRSQRRRSQFPGGGSFGGSSGGLGGGVLRRGSSRRSTRSTSRRRRSSARGSGGSRSFGRGSGGSRRL